MRSALASTASILFVACAFLIWAASIAGAGMPEQLRRAGPAWFTMAPLLVLVVPFCEEAAFRGYLYGRLARGAGGIAAPVVVSSIVFTALHLPGSLKHAATLLVLALVLGVLRGLSGSIWPGLVVHAAWNGALLALMTVTVTASAG